MIRRELMNCSKDDLESFTDDEIDYAVAEHINWIQSAVGDMAQFNPDTFEIRTDWTEIDCAADEAYDDPELLRSLIGDYMPINRAFGTFRVLYSFHEQGHKAIKMAVENIAKDWC